MALPFYEKLSFLELYCITRDYWIPTDRHKTVHTLINNLTRIGSQTQETDCLLGSHIFRALSL